MGCRGLPTIHPGSSIPEMFNFVRYSFRQREFDLVQNTLMEREKQMQIKISNLSTDCDSLKKDIDKIRESYQSTLDLEKGRMGKEIDELRHEKLGLEEKLHSSLRKFEERDDRLASLEKEVEALRHEKLSLEEKVHSSRRKFEERDDRLASLEKEVETLRHEKLSLEEKLDSSRKKLGERDDRLVSLEKELEDLRHEKLSLEEKLNSSCRKLEERDDRLVRMEKEVEDLWHEKDTANQTIDVLKGKEIEATQAIDELRVRLEAALAKMLHVNVEDLSKLINVTDVFAAAAIGGSGGVESSKEGGRTLDLECSTTKEDGIGQDNGGKITEVKDGSGKASCAAGNGKVIMISDDESDDDGGEIYGQRNKRNRGDEDSLANWSVKRKRLEETCTDSDSDESCSDACIENLIATFHSKATKEHADPKNA